MWSAATPASSPILWPFIVIILIAFLIWTEDGSQNLNNPRAHHQPPSITATDLPDDIISKVKIAVRNSSEVVGWRRALIVSLILSLILLFLLLPVFPAGFTIFLITLLFFVPIYFISVWFSSTYLKRNANNLQQALDQISKLN